MFLHILVCVVFVRHNTQSQLLLRVGFEPTHLTILDLKSSALDHSAI